MRLILHVPERCPRHDLDGDRTLIALEGLEPRPAITLTLIHPKILPMSALEWSTEVTREDVPAGLTAWDMGCHVDRRGNNWQTSVFHTILLEGSDPAPREIRLTAIYHFTPFHPYDAAVIARIHDPARFEAARPWLMELLLNARLDWTSPEVASISELYDGV